MQKQILLDVGVCYDSILNLLNLRSAMSACRGLWNELYGSLLRLKDAVLLLVMKQNFNPR